MTKYKALTMFFFQSKRIPPKLWNYCDQALQFDFVLAHVPGTEYPAADYLSRADINPQDRIHLKRNDQIPIYHVEFDLEPKTPKQDDSEEDYNPDKPNNVRTTADNPNLQSLLNAVPQLPSESNDDLNTRF